MDVFVVVLIVVACVSFIVLIGKGNEKQRLDNLNNEKFNTGSDSVEDSLAEVTPTPSTPGEVKGIDGFEKGCLFVFVILIGLGIFVAYGVSQIGKGIDSFFGGVKKVTDSVDSVVYPNGKNPWTK